MASENSSPNFSSLQLPSGSETMATLQGAIDQINGQVEHLENENRETQFQVGWLFLICWHRYVINSYRATALLAYLHSDFGYTFVMHFCMFCTLFLPLQLCHINNPGVLDGESFAQRILALEEDIEQLNDRMRELEVKLEGTQSTPITLPYPHLVENCCAPSVFVHGRLEYECPSLCACLLHQDVSPHTHNWHCVVSGRTN